MKKERVYIILLFITVFVSCKRNQPIRMGVEQVSTVKGLSGGLTGSDPATVMVNKIISNMVLVQGGEFKMGCSDEINGNCDDNEKPAHDVTLSGFGLSKYDVTVKEFECFIKEVGYVTSAERQGFSCLGTDANRIKIYGLNWRCNTTTKLLQEGEKSNPVLFVSWYDAIEFCRWLTIKSGKKFRLPTSSEYEFAARGGINGHGYKYAGSDDLNEVAWNKQNSGGNIHSVGQKRPNELGLYDMSGLVYQWSNDWDSDMPPVTSLINPKGPEKGTYRVIRGSACNRPAKFHRLSLLHSREPGFSNGNCGFRVALDL